LILIEIAGVVAQQPAVSPLRKKIQEKRASTWIGRNNQDLRDQQYLGFAKSPIERTFLQKQKNEVCTGAYVGFWQ